MPYGNHLEYRSLLAFARYEGLRVPSEIRDLKFSDFRNLETGIIFTVPDSGKTGKRQVPVFEDFLPYLEELRKHRKEGQVELFEHCRKGKNVGTLIRKRIVKAGLPLWKKFFTNLRSSCITDKDKTINNVYRMNAIFGNSEQIRSKHYRQPDTDEEYAALGGFGEKRESGSKRSKKLPSDLPSFGDFGVDFARLYDLHKRRLSVMEIFNLLIEEKGLDKKSFNKLVEANPTFSEMENFMNSLLLKSYDDFRKFNSDEFLKDCMRMGIKVPLLL